MPPYLNTSMLRERFVIHSLNEQGEAFDSAIALGNRIVVTVKGSNINEPEHLIIRGHNMHCVARASAKIFQDFDSKGAILDLARTYNWQELWEHTCSTYERRYNPYNWLAIYYKGQVLFSLGERHAFLDIMEQCDASNREEYDKAIHIAEDVFLKAGKPIQIEKDTNIAAVVGLDDHKARCGLILRNPIKSTTFNFTLEPREDKSILKTRNQNIEPNTCLNMSAAFLEAIQLAFTVGRLSAVIKDQELSRMSAEYLQMDGAQKRIGRLNNEIKSYENMYHARFRPERPDIFALIDQTEEMFRA